MFTNNSSLAAVSPIIGNALFLFDAVEVVRDSKIMVESVTSDEDFRNTDYGPTAIHKPLKNLLQGFPVFASTCFFLNCKFAFC